MTFKTIHTIAGLQAISEAQTAGSPINLTEMAVGDGNGNPVEPVESQATLVRERFRAAVNRVYQDSTDATRFTAELVIPASEGGFTLREVGLFDDQGTLFVVGNLPETYKPESSEGSFADTVVRVEFVCSNASIITLQVDPNVTVATQTWISNNITAGALIPGGTTGQVLKKKSNTDGDTEWGDPDTANVTVDVIAEQQTLADSQVIVDLTQTTTYGLAVYIDGLRLNQGSGSDEWQPDEVIETRLTLGQSYVAGTKILCVQNEPAGSAPAPLERNKNLQDLADKPTARTNLEVHSKTESNAAGQPGDIKYTARQTAPTGWLKANGAAVSRTAYAALFSAIGITYGAGDGFSTFNLPDLRGEFMRGWDDGRGVDGGRALGSTQSDDLGSHSHSASTNSTGGHTHSGNADSAGAHSHSASTGTTGAHTHSYKDTFFAEYNGSTKGADGRLHEAQSVGSGDSDTDNNYKPYMNRTTETAGNHSHSVSVGNAGNHSHNLSINSAGNHSHSVSVQQSGGSETRPRNIAMLALIKY